MGSVRWGQRVSLWGARDFVAPHLTSFELYGFLGLGLRAGVTLQPPQTLRNPKWDFRTWYLSCRQARPDEGVWDSPPAATVSPQYSSRVSRSEQHDLFVRYELGQQPLLNVRVRQSPVGACFAQLISSSRCGWDAARNQPMVHVLLS